MVPGDRESNPPPDVQAYYAGFPEESRLETGTFRLEFERTKAILARIVDVGGAAGAYSLWLAERGYEVHLVDTSSRLVDEARVRSASARTPIASLSVAAARWENPALRKDLLDVTRILEEESSAIGVSAHLLGIGRKP